jgi:hypothetical protein
MPLVVAGLAVVLFALWIAATRRHARRRAAQRDEWDDAVRVDLWTSAARCPSCGARGGVLRMEGEELWFVCLSCRARHRRRTRG